MIATSQAWKNAQSGVIVPEAFVEIAYKVTDPDLHDGIKESNNGAEDFSRHERIAELTVSNQRKYATLEHNDWALDGSAVFLEDGGDTGFVSDEICGSYGRFEKNPLIVLDFDYILSKTIPGVTLTWGNGFDDYAESFKITAYRNNEEVQSGTFVGSETKTECDFSVSGINRVEIEILSWSMPYRRARVQRVFFGVAQTFTKSDFISYEHEQTADILSAALPKNEVIFSLSNVEGKWNPDNPSGSVRYLSERQEINVRYGLKLDDGIEWIKAGTFWISEWDTPSNGIEARFTARDAIEFMNDPYTGTLVGTLYDIALAAFEQSDLPRQEDGSLRYLISANLKEYRADTSGESNVNLSCAEIVQLCANAACCVFYQDRDGVLRVEPLRENATGYQISKFNCYSHPEFILSKPLKAVNVNNGLSIAVNSNVGEIQSVLNELITNEVSARRVAEWTRRTLEGRKTITGEYRADPSMDVLDKVATESKYGANNALYITSIKYTFNGAFHGVYTGRLVDFDKEIWYSGELISGKPIIPEV